MRTLRSLIVGVICSLIAAPATSKAQDKDQAQDFVHDVLGAIFGPNWNIFAHAGLTTQGRFVLQDPIGLGGQRALKSENAFTVGAGAGVDILLRTGFRLGYSFTASDLVFRTDNGDGSEMLDDDDGGTLQSHTAAIEVVRYMLPARAAITPYASAGVLGSWWVLDDDGSSLVGSSTGSTQFRLGALGSFGLQFRLSDHLTARTEIASASVRNPFTGSESFRAFGGATIDEPGRVGKTDFRFVGVYSFGKREPPSLSVNSEQRVR